MPYNSSGGPPINTGNAAWDQGLGSIFSGAFPDPSKVAQAGYYGAEQRNKQLQSSKLRDQMARQQVLDAAANTLTMPDTSYAASPEGPNMPPIMQPPGSAPAPTLSATVAPGPAAAATPPPAAPAPPPAAPAAGTVGANMAPGGLSGLFAGGGGAVPDGGGTVRLDQGTPPPTSSPAPGAGAPPASNATASDGSVPNNDAVSGIFHPGSITPPGGGRKTTGPADANGAPAKPMMTAAQYVNLAVSAGHDANQALLEWRSMISSMYDTGRIDENTYHHMMGAADPSIITTDATNTANIKRTGMEQAGATTRTGMEQAGATTRQGMVTGETSREFNEAIIQTVNPADPNGPPIPVMRKDLKPGMQEWSQPLASQNVVTNENRRQFNEAIVQVVNPADPNGPPLAMKRSDMKPGMQEWNSEIAKQRGTPVLTNTPNGPVNRPMSETIVPGANQPTVYTPGTADIQQTQQGAYGTFVDPNDADPTHARTMTNAEAAAKGWIPYGTMAPKTPMTANESFQQGAQAHSLDQEIYPQAQKGSLTSPGYVSAPVVFSPKMQAQIQALTARFMRDPATRGDPGAAHRMAVQALQQSGDLPSATQVEALRNAGGIISTAGGRVTDPRLTVSPNYDGKGTTTPHLWVGGKDEKNPNDPGAPTAFNPEPGPRAGSNVTPQTPPGPQQPQTPPVASGPAYRPTSEIFGSGGGPPAPGTTLGPAPVPAWQSYLNRPGTSGPAPLTPGQMYGGVPTAPPAPAAPAAPAAPNQPIARAAPNQRDGDIAYLNGRPIGIVRGGAVYPMPAQAGPGGGG